MSTDDKGARTANIFDVARLAGVSHQTVSRVLNDLPNVRPATRARVEQAIAQLRYSPSPAARALVTRRTRTIGLVSPGVSDFGPSSIAMHFNFAARAARYSVETVSSLDDDPTAVQGARRVAAAPAGRRDRAHRRRRGRARGGARPRAVDPGRRRRRVAAPQPAHRVDRPVPRRPRGGAASGRARPHPHPAPRRPAQEPGCDRARTRLARRADRAAPRHREAGPRRLVGGERVRRGGASSTSRRARPSSSPTTTWPSGCSRRSASGACGCPRT